MGLAGRAFNKSDSYERIIRIVLGWAAPRSTGSRLHMVREIPLPKTNGRGTAQWSILSGTCAIAIAEAPLEVPGRASLRMFI